MKSLVTFIFRSRTVVLLMGILVDFIFLAKLFNHIEAYRAAVTLTEADSIAKMILINTLYLTITSFITGMLYSKNKKVPGIKTKKWSALPTGTHNSKEI